MKRISKAIRREAREEGESPQHEAMEKRMGDKDDAKRRMSKMGKRRG